jgi:hypothetical protein
MPKKNDDFFKEKKPWSEVKDELLECYLKPYIQKVLHTRKLFFASRNSPLLQNIFPSTGGEN